MKKGAFVAIIGALAFAPGAQAVTLVNADGTPLGGQWQQWASEMHVASWAGLLTVEGDCPALSVCFTPSADPTAASIGLPTGRAKRTYLYLNLAYEFDARYLTNGNRATLTHWLSQDTGSHLTAWDVGNPSAAAYYFADAYSWCAEADRVNEDRRICRFVNRVRTD